MPAELPADVYAALQKHWGYTSLRPLQTEAVAAGLAGRDSLVVLPTGGGKSLCYQLPAIVRGGLTVVISPLIALMKDQVDSLKRIGIPAVRLDSSNDNNERMIAEDGIRSGEVRLAFCSPERLINSDVANLFRCAKAHTVAIDEAHCVSHWGHDFRPEYRQMARLREILPGVAVHAYTATATKHVQADIVTQLALKNAQCLVGNFDRANLTFRILPQVDVGRQVKDVLERHKGYGGIVYCQRRKDVDNIAALLAGQGYKAVPYHAGMSPDERRKAQDAFVREKADVVVATIAFGMGIDRSNVRFVVHAAMPKSLEHYQQETGRAGRDGLPAECVLLYSGGDVVSLKSLVTKSNAENNVEPAITAATLAQIEEMARFCRGAVCRHAAIVSYFGQTYPNANCGACDLCLGDLEEVPDATLIAKKILSGVARVNESFGINYVIEVLRGSTAKNVIDRGHDKLTTWGLLQSHPVGELRDYIHQLIGQGMLAQSEGEYPLLKLTPGSWKVMRGECMARFVKLKADGVRKSKGTAERPAGVDDGLFEVLRKLRKEIATEDNVPPYLVFTDNVLLEFARGRPGTLPNMRLVSGVGDKKLRDYGDRFLAAILEYATENNLPLNVPLGRAEPPPPPPVPDKMTVNKTRAFTLFKKNLSLVAVVNEMSLARSTVTEYLVDFIRLERPESIRAWVSEATEHRIREAGKEHGIDKMKPAFLAMNEEVPYDAIKIVFARMENE
ncbi:DNA helicase RecQ [soil metagenome]